MGKLLYQKSNKQNSMKLNKKKKQKTELVQKANQTLEKVFKHKKLKALSENQEVKLISPTNFKSKKNKGQNTLSTNVSELNALLQVAENYAPQANFLIVDNCEAWTSQLIVESKEPKPTSLFVRKKLKEAAAYFYEHDVKIQRSKGYESSSSNSKLRKIVLSHGTAKDVVSALASYCLDVPIHSLHEVQRLISFINPKRKQHSAKPIDILSTLFKSTYLIDGYVAKEFECHSFSSLLPYVTKSPELAIKQLVLWYFEDQLRMCYLQLIENLTLLSNQEISKIQSLAIAKMAKFVAEHPKQDAEIPLSKIINKLGDKLPKIAGGAISQLRIIQTKCPELKPLLVSLIHTFLYRKGCTERSQFYGLCVLKDISLSRNDPLTEKLIDIYLQFFTNCIKKGAVDNRFVSCLLRGINQAFSMSKYEMLQQKLDSMYIMCHLVSFNRATQVAQLIYQTFAEKLSERFYNLIYKMIINPEFGKSCNITTFLNLLYKSMAQDVESVRVQAFFKRLFQVSLYLPADAVCGILLVSSQVFTENKHIEKIRHSLLGNQSVNGRPKEKSKKSTVLKAHRDSEDLLEKGKQYFRNSYDCKSVNPLYSGADLSNLWELYTLQNHCHPSVGAFVSQLFTNAVIDYSGDPFKDFSNAKFLSRFVQKNQKKINYEGNNMYAINKQYVPDGARKYPVNSQEFCETAEEDIAVDELFFYNYYKYHGKSSIKVEENMDIDDDEFESIMKQKHFNAYINPDLKDIDFAKSAEPVKATLDHSTGDDSEIDVTEDFDDEEYEEEGENLEDEELSQDLDYSLYDTMENYEEEFLDTKVKIKSKVKVGRKSHDYDNGGRKFPFKLKSNVNSKGSQQSSSTKTASASVSARKNSSVETGIRNMNFKRKRASPKTNKYSKRSKI